MWLLSVEGMWKWAAAVVGPGCHSHYTGGSLSHYVRWVNGPLWEFGDVASHLKRWKFLYSFWPERQDTLLSCLVAQLHLQGFVTQHKCMSTTNQGLQPHRRGFSCEWFATSFRLGCKNSSSCFSVTTFCVSEEFWSKLFVSKPPHRLQGQNTAKTKRYRV